jgi:hypothetical protein
VTKVQLSSALRHSLIDGRLKESPASHNQLIRLLVKGLFSWVICPTLGVLLGKENIFPFSKSPRSEQTPNQTILREWHAR